MEGNCDNPSPPPPLNEDSLIQILLWLPVISLLRFKSVCKSWRAIIQNPFFIHTHATTTTIPTTTIALTTNATNRVVFLRYPYTLLRGDILTVVSGDEFDVLEDLGMPGPGFEVFEHTWEYFGHYEKITMAGCCNGIICFLDSDHHKCCIDTISLWNPAIKQYRFLPIPFALEEDEKNHCGECEELFAEHGFQGHCVEQVVGFGFDVKTKDYKVLLITYDFYVLRKYYHARGVQVYSLSTDSWRCIDASDALPNLLLRMEERNQGHYLNGTYLFISGYLYEEEEGDDEFQEPTTSSRKKCFGNVIMSFDFTQESFRTIQLPFDLKLETETPNRAYVILFGERIAVTNTPQDLRVPDPACVDIWVLNEYGGSESWSKFYTFVSSALPKLNTFVSSARPKFITDHGEFILLDAVQDVFQGAPKLKLLNVVTEEIKDLQDDDDGPSPIEAFRPIRYARVGVYKPSLIPIAGHGATDNCLQV